MNAMLNKKQQFYCEIKKKKSLSSLWYGIQDGHLVIPLDSGSLHTWLYTTFMN